MSELPSDFWYPGKDGRKWEEKFPHPRHFAPSSIIDEVIRRSEKKPTIYDQLGRPIEDRELNESDKPEEN